MSKVHLRLSFARGRGHSTSFVVLHLQFGCKLNIDYPEVKKGLEFGIHLHLCVGLLSYFLFKKRWVNSWES